jgi:lysophospholipase L1-like esterase
MLGQLGRPLIHRLLVAALVLGGWFVAFEAFLRWWGGSEAAPVFQQLFMPDDVIGYRLRPGQSVTFATREFTTAIATNAQGVRDAADIGPKPPGERRIVVLGDSLVLAVQVPFEATFCQRLQARLNAHAPPGVRYRVINAGVQGYGPVEELLFYREVASRFGADLVLVATFVANDAVEAFDAAWRLDGRDARPAAAAARDETGRTLRRLVRRSMVLQIARQRADQVLERASLKTVAPSRPVASYLETPPDFIPAGLAVAARALATLAQEASAQGARTVIALVPARFQLDPAEYERLREATEPIGGPLRVDGASERFRAAVAPLGLPTIDLLPALRDAPPGQFFPGTVHFTAAGHETIAAALDAFIRREGLLDPPAVPAPAATPVAPD